MRQYNGATIFKERDVAVTRGGVRSKTLSVRYVSYLFGEVFLSDVQAKLIRVSKRQGSAETE